MNDARTTREIDLPRALRAQRGAAAVVAQYIHELSGRHAGARRRDSGGRRASPDGERGLRQQPGAAIYAENLTVQETGESPRTSKR